MTAPDLDVEFCAAGDYGAPAIARFRQLGIPDELIFGLRSYLGVARVQADEDGTYQPHPNGRSMLVIPEGEPGDPCGWIAFTDLVALHASEPGRWWTRTATIDLLGESNLRKARLFGDPLHLHATPLDWLRAGATGVCVVNWSFDPQAALADVERIVCASPMLEKRLRKRMRETAPRPPSITVTEGVRDAA